ncbi:MAG: nucleoside hydrolase [Candidatus Paceibacterota bacterium]
MRTFFSALCILLAGCAVNNTMPKQEVPETSFARMWIDTDAACGVQTGDPDDCLALHMALRANVEIVGVSPVAGNTSLSGVIKSLALFPELKVFLHEAGSCHSPAAKRFAEASQEGELVLLALGPLSNVADFLSCDEVKQEHVHVVAVGGRPSPEVPLTPNPDHWISIDLRDLNVELDPNAARETLEQAELLSLVPFEASREVVLEWGDIARLSMPTAAQERLQNWSSLASWLWGIDGLLPFDAVAVGLVLWPEQFECFPVETTMAGEMLVAQIEQGAAGGERLYCLPLNGELLKQNILALASN